MRRRYVAALSTLALAGAVTAAVPATASAGTDRGANRHCAAGFHAAVVEDNEAYNAHDAARYEAILNPRMIFWQDGVTTYGRDAIMATARANFGKHCEGCHGPNGEGGPVKVDNKQIKVPSLKSDHAIKHTDDQIAKMITNGEEAMPAFKDKMSQQEIGDMVKFVRTNFQGK